MFVRSFHTYYDRQSSFPFQIFMYLDDNSRKLISLSEQDARTLIYFLNKNNTTSKQFPGFIRLFPEQSVNYTFAWDMYGGRFDVFYSKGGVRCIPSDVFIIEADLAGELSKTLSASFSAENIPISTGDTPINIIKEETDPLVGAKKRMDDNLRRVFG